MRLVLDRALGYFADHGIARVERLMTDNAWAYRWSLREVCAAHGITGSGTAGVRRPLGASGMMGCDSAAR